MRKIALTVTVPLLAVLLLVVLVAACGGHASPTTTVTSELLSTTSSESTTSSLAPTSTEETTTTAPEVTSSTMAAAPGTFTATLSGDSEVPAVSTSATGTLTLSIGSSGQVVHYVLEVTGLTDITLARLHEGKAGTTGNVICTFYPGPTKSGPFSGTLAAGSFGAQNLAGPLKGKSLADLEDLVKSGDVYVNVGTTLHTYGEIRGQLK